MKNYLKDQGGQFWGAFSQSLAQSVKEERDRPLKEAMMKAQLGHQQAVQKKMEMDLRQAQQQEADMNNLISVLQPKPVPAQPAQVNTNVSEGDMPVQTQPAQPATMRAPDMQSPEVRAALLKAGHKGEVLSQAAKAAFPATNAAASNGVLFSDWDDLNAFMASPNYEKAFPQGSRTVVTKNGIQLQGINPVNPEASIFHTPASRGGGADAAINYANRRAATNAAANVAGRAAQETGEAIQPVQPFAGQQPAGQPGQQATAPAGQGRPPGTENMSPAQYSAYLKKQATTSASPIPEGLAKQQRDYVTLLNTTIADIEANFDESFLGARGLPGAQTIRESFAAPYLEQAGITTQSSEQEVIFRKALADAKDQLLRSRSGAQINESEARRLAELLPAATATPTAFRAAMARFRQQVEASIANGKLFANVSRQGLQGVESKPTPTPLPGQTGYLGGQQKGGGKQLPSGWEFTK